MLHLKNQSGIKNVVELGCGFWNYTARIHQLGLNVKGPEILKLPLKNQKKDTAILMMTLRTNCNLKWPNLAISKN